MTDVENALSASGRRELRKTVAAMNDPFIRAIPKVELHVHIGGCITPELRWRFAQRNGSRIMNSRTGSPYISFEELEDASDTLKPRASGPMTNSEETSAFFEALYAGYEALETKQDFYDLAMHYFEHAAAMNIRYSEIFFNPQGHTRCGMSWETMMGGFRKAQEEAERDLKVKSAWIMCFLRDESPESAMEHYVASLDYRDMIVGIGLDSNEDQRPPMLFQDVYIRARKDGFRLTAHCDVGKTYPLEHIRQVVSELGGAGADRIDHGLNGASDPAIVEDIRRKGLGMTITPWSYIRHQPMDDVFSRIRTLFDAGIKINIASDDPALMEDTWIWENMLVVKKFCNFSNEEIRRLARDSIDMCWAPEPLKEEMRRGLQAVDVGG